MRVLISMYFFPIIGWEGNLKGRNDYVQNASYSEKNK